jgi:hypothetical protein
MSDYWSEDGQQKLALELASWDLISLLQTPNLSNQVPAPAELNFLSCLLKKINWRNKLLLSRASIG